jgi:hypothetical protein
MGCPPRPQSKFKETMFLDWIVGLVIKIFGFRVKARLWRQTQSANPMPQTYASCATRLFMIHANLSEFVRINLMIPSVLNTSWPTATGSYVDVWLSLLIFILYKRVNCVRRSISVIKCTRNIKLKRRSKFITENEVNYIQNSFMIFTLNLILLSIRDNGNKDMHFNKFMLVKFQPKQCVSQCSDSVCVY